MSIRKVAV